MNPLISYFLLSLSPESQSRRPPLRKLRLNKVWRGCDPAPTTFRLTSKPRHTQSRLAGLGALALHKGGQGGVRSTLLPEGPVDIGFNICKSIEELHSNKEADGPKHWGITSERVLWGWLSWQTSGRRIPTERLHDTAYLQHTYILPTYYLHQVYKYLHQAYILPQSSLQYTYRRPV